MNKRLLVLLWTCFLVLAWCSMETEKSNMWKTNAKDSIKVGVIGPLSWPLACYGDGFKKGFELIQSEQPEELQNKFSFVFEDDQYDAKLALNAYRKLVSVDKVDAVFAYSANGSKTIAPLLDDDKMPTFLNTVNTDLNTQYWLRILPQVSDFTDVMYETYIKPNNIKKVGAVIADDEWLSTFYNSYAATLGSGIELIDKFEWGHTDFRSTIEKIKAGQYDTLLVLLGSDSVSNFLKQLRQADIKTQVIASEYLESKEEVKAANGAAEWAIWVYSDIPPGWFVDLYTEKFGSYEECARDSIFAYDFMKYLYQHSDQIHNSEDIYRLFTSWLVLTWVGGTYEYRKNNDDAYMYVKPVVKKIQDGEVRLY